MDSIDSQDKLIKLMKYGKYLLILLLALIVFLVIKGCTRNYSDIESDMIDAAKNYIAENNINFVNEYYVEISYLDDIEGTELCSKSSGVIITNKAGKLEYKAYLKCNDYESNIVNNSEKYITLKEGNVIILNNGEIFVDPNYVINKELLDGYVDIKGTVLKTPGVYTLTYNVYQGEVEANSNYVANDNISDENIKYTLKDTLTRKVIVINNDKNASVSGLLNTEYPILTLKGEKKMTLALNEKYNEPGFVAVDYTDGKISRKVSFNSIDTKELGNYTITYTIVNSKGNSALAVRQVEVVKERSNLVINIEGSDSASNEININYNVEGDGFDRIVLPNGTETAYRTGQYKVNANAIYTFRIYDRYNNEYIKEVDISNVDDIAPTGSCTATTTQTKTAVNVNANDNKGIAGYSFVLNGVVSPYQENSNFEASLKANKVTVNVKDIAGNISSLTCAIEEGNEEYINEKGYNCLQPFSCFKQGDYTSEQSKYLYCSTDTCGPINKRGCSITSVTTLVSGFGVKDASGQVYTPYTILTDVYKQVCDSYCSGSTTAERVFTRLGLTVTKNPTTGKNYFDMTAANVEILKDHLRKGGAALLRVGKGWYTNGGHLMAILGINDAGLVYLYDPGAKIGTMNGAFHPVNTFVSTDDIIAGGGESCWFELVSK